MHEMTTVSISSTALDILFSYVYTHRMSTAYLYQYRWEAVLQSNGGVSSNIVRGESASKYQRTENSSEPCLMRFSTVLHLIHESCILLCNLKPT